MARLARLTLILILMGALSSCDTLRVYVGVVRAVNDFSHGDYQSANRALISSQRTGAFEPWISYNLGTVYQALGESASAMDIWMDTPGDEGGALAFRLAFNLGVLAYQRGDYDAAYRYFREALVVDPSSIEAKVNLEYAVEKLESSDTARSDRETDAEPGAEVDRVLQYLERLEQNSWGSAEAIREDPGVRDW